MNFDLQTGGNIMDFQLFCKRPSANFYEFSKVHRLDEAEAVKEQARPPLDAKPSPVPAQLAVLSNVYQILTDSNVADLFILESVTPARTPVSKVQTLASKQIQMLSSPSLSEAASSSQQSKLVEKAKQVSSYFIPGDLFYMLLLTGSVHYAENKCSAKRRAVVRAKASQATRTAQSKSALGLLVGRNGLVSG